MKRGIFGTQPEPRSVLYTPGAYTVSAARTV